MLPQALAIATDKTSVGRMQDQMLDFHPKVFSRSTVKGNNSGLQASLKTQGEPKCHRRHH